MGKEKTLSAATVNNKRERPKTSGGSTGQTALSGMGGGGLWGSPALVRPPSDFRKEVFTERVLREEEICDSHHSPAIT